jgi:hypothetical protein
MFETRFGLARDGKVDPKRNVPTSLLQMAVLARDYREEITLPGIAGVAMRGMSSILAPLARARGYRSRYPEYSGPDSF